MTKTLGLLIVGALIVAVGAAPATGAKKRTRTVSQNWEVVAAPFPGADDHSDPANECGVEGVSYGIHSFSTPGKGKLTTLLSGFEGEWDLYVTDGDGSVLGSSVNFMTGSEEKVTLSLPAKTEVRIYACNFLGGPTAQAELKYVYRK